MNEKLMMQGKTCKTCHWWDFYAIIKNVEFGRCKRFPPSILSDDSSIEYSVTKAPFVPGSDFCGEWKENE